MNYDMCNLTQNLLIMIMEADMVYFQLTVVRCPVIDLTFNVN